MQSERKGHVFITTLIIRLLFTCELWCFLWSSVCCVLIYRLKIWVLCRCTYRARHCSRYEGNGKRGFSGVIPLTQPALALLVVVPIHGWEGHVSEKCGPQTPPQGPPAFCLHWRADAVSQLPVRLFLRLHLRTDQLQRADHCCWTHWRTRRKQGEKDSTGVKVNCNWKPFFSLVEHFNWKKERIIKQIVVTNCAFFKNFLFNNCSHLLKQSWTKSGSQCVRLCFKMKSSVGWNYRHWGL